MEYPNFTVDENGNIVSSQPEASGSAVLAPPEDPVDGIESDLFDDLNSSSDTVSSGDSIPSPIDYTDSFSSLEEPLAYLAAEQASSSGYLSASCLDAFDRVVEAWASPYYCAFRNSSDSYNGVLYIAKKADVNGSVISFKDAVRVELYRTQSGGNYNYQYYYSKSSAGDVEVSLGNNLMYYTNCVEGYPLLAGVQNPSVKLNIVFYILIAALFVWLLGRFLIRRFSA